MEPLPSSDALAGRVVVVSPHLDDGVLSLGAAISAAARGGARLELLTVFACDPFSEAEAGGWDSRGGHRTEGESARARREEDSRACEILGVTPAWLPYGSVDYERHGEEDEVRSALAAATGGADIVLLPGSPLTHPDHEWLLQTFLRESTSGLRVGLYAEQPYSRRAGVDPQAPGWLQEELGVAPRFRRVPVGAGDRFRKWRAIRQYRSQLPLLGMRRSLRRGPLSIAWHPEAIAWVGDRGRGRG